MSSCERSPFMGARESGDETSKPSNPPTSPQPGHKLTGMTPVRGPPLSSQKYKSFHYSRVTSVVEEDNHLEGSTAPSSCGGSFNCNVETEDNTSLETMMLRSGRSPENGTPSNFLMIDENSNGAGAGNSESSLHKMSTLSVHANDRPAGYKRFQRLVLSPPSLHMSFDVEHIPWPTHQHALIPEKPISKSSDNVTHRLHPHGGGEDMQHSATGHLQSPASYMTKPPGSFSSTKSHHGQSFEIANISAGYMRTAGAMGQFRGVLSAPSEKSSLKVRGKQGSKEKERIKKETYPSANKNSFSTTTLTAFFGHSHHKDSVEQPLATSVDEATDAFPTGTGGQSIKNFSMDPDQSASRIHFTKPPSSDQQKQPDQKDCSDDNENNRSCRLEYHRALFSQRGKACDYSFGFAMLGIILMIIETELTATGIYTKDSINSYALKSLIVMSTIVLLVLILVYHATDIRLFMLDHGCDDFRIAIRTKRLLMITMELLICMICPVPGNFYFEYIPNGHAGSNGNESTAWSIPSPTARVPVDIFLSIPMFLRLYLLCRLMLLHSKLFTDGPSRSISALNRVNITSRLVLKMMMTVSPVSVLMAFTGSFWLTAAWIMLVCERYGSHLHVPSSNSLEYEMKKHQSVVDLDSYKYESYLNSIWLVAVTSLTIGYGDVVGSGCNDQVPSTYCGRTVSIICGIVGAGTSSLVVAVVAKKLEFSRAEKHVHNFMMDSLLTKRMKNAAANVLRETWLIYKYRKIAQKVDASKIRLHQRKFLLAIYELRKTKRGRRKLDENFITVADMAKTTSMMYEIVSDMRAHQQEMEQKILDTEKRCANVESYIGQLQVSICALPELVARKLRPPSPLR